MWSSPDGKLPIVPDHAPEAVMCHQIELTITLVKYMDSQASDAWVTETVPPSHSEVIYAVCGAPPAIQRAIEDLIDFLVLRPH